MVTSESFQVYPHRGGEVWGLHLIVSSNCQSSAEVLSGFRDGAKDLLWIREPEVKNGTISPSEGPVF